MATNVVTRCRRPNQNLRPRLLRIAARAGEKAWPKLWHNLRSSRQTELEEQFPTHVVCAWLGNSEIVARAHYLQVRDAHFDQANGKTVKGVQSAAQNPAQQAHAVARNVPQASTIDRGKALVFQGSSTKCESVREPNMTPTGSEQVAISASSTLPPSETGAKLGAPSDPELNEVLDAWELLTVGLRRAILSIVRSR